MSVVAVGKGRVLNPILESGRTEARESGSATVEAAHLLLALAASEDAAVRRALAAAGLDRGSIRQALDREFEHSLAAVGVTDLSRDLPRPSPAPERPSQIGASARLALSRAMQAAAETGEFGPAHLLLGVLRGPVGTVARALELAGVDRDRMAAELGAALRGANAR